MTLNLCRTVTAFCDNLGYVLIKQCVWVSKCWYHCCSNLDLPSRSKYHSFLDSYAQKNSIWLVAEKDKDLSLLALATGPSRWTTFPHPGWMLQPQSKSGVHIWPLWLLTFNFYSLEFDSGGVWKISLTPGKHIVTQNQPAPLLNTLSKSSLKPVNEPANCL